MASFLDRSFSGNQALIGFIQRSCGYCLSGTVGEHVLPILHGVGANGKSTLTSTVMGLLGQDYSMKLPRNMLMVSKHNEHATQEQLDVRYEKQLTLGKLTVVVLGLREELAQGARPSFAIWAVLPRDQWSNNEMKQIVVERSFFDRCQGASPKLYDVYSNHPHRT